MVRVGIIGCGKIAQTRHIPEYLANKNAEIKGFYDINEARTGELARRFGAKAYASVEEMLSDPDIDAVSICTANKAHAGDTIKVLNAGKHALCEKPMATELKDCEAMVEAAKKNGKKLMIDQNQRLVRTHRLAKSIIERGDLGKVISFATSFGHGGPETWSIDPGVNTWFFDRKQSGMGAMADLGVHKTDLIQYLLDTYVVETTAKVVTLDKKDATGSLIGVDDNAFCIYQMADGVVGTMRASWTYYGPEDNSTIIYGELGIMRIFDDPDCSIRMNMKDGSEICYHVDRIQTNDNQTSTGIIDAFIESIENNTEPCISGESVLKAMNAVFGSIESSDKGCAVKVNQ